SERTGKVLIDWSQNNGAKTTIAPYSLRGRAHPTVAAPRLWSELDSPDLDQLTFEEVLARTERLGDPMAPLGFPTGGSESGKGPLSSYIAKRSAARTPEPVPSHPTPAEPRGVAAGADRPSFVIQEHHATALHWDFRLEHDGVFVSWAVPKGVPPTAARNSLAIMTEDHPLDYGTFEGTIPRGEYGAGTVTIWDHGHYDLEKWRDDEIILTASGAPGGPLGRVRLALIRTDGSGEKSTWLLHRMKTDATGRAQPDGAPVAPRNVSPSPSPSPESVSESDGSGHDERVVDGDTLIEGAAAAPAAFRRIAPMLATGSTAGLARAAAHRWRGHATADTAWAEVKWDGIRAIGTWDGTGLRLAARSGTDVTARYPELTGLSARLAAASAIVDGEIVALDARGRPSFTLLQNRMHLSKPREIAREATRTPVKFYLFDVLEFEGRDLTGLPLVERREILESLAANAIADVVVPPVFEDVDAALAASRQFGLEGVMVKNPHSRYRPGDRSEDWLKVKITHTQEVVIGGIRPGRGGRTGSIGSLLVGIPDAEGLRYAGRVGSGFSEAALAQLDAMLTPLRADTDPFVGVPPADASDALWVRPELVGEVEFAEFTPGGILRHARWRGLRSDKAATEVVRED
ncbi:MAG: non-homologous end-joining DNA ligase, partial [Actinobacteria bacterium]|nr:non-homologous end-joining DNA ligase [Actinomycetota bacterium]